MNIDTSSFNPNLDNNNDDLTNLRKEEKVSPLMKV